jgi:hypothetical protein
MRSCEPVGSRDVIAQDARRCRCVNERGRCHRCSSTGPHGSASTSSARSAQNGPGPRPHTGPRGPADRSPGAPPGCPWRCGTCAANGSRWLLRPHSDGLLLPQHPRALGGRGAEQGEEERHRIPGEAVSPQPRELNRRTGAPVTLDSFPEWRRRRHRSAGRSRARSGSPGGRARRPCRRGCANRPPSPRRPSRRGGRARGRAWGASVSTPLPRRRVSRSRQGISGAAPNPGPRRRP